jgi:hypothetical protein
MAAAVVALAGLAPLAKKARATADGISGLADKVVALAFALLEDNWGVTALCRAAAELVAAACCIGTDAFILRQVRALCQQLTGSISEGRGVEARGMLVMALGCIHRAKGGMVLQQVGRARWCRLWAGVDCLLAMEMQSCAVL